jgi:hypothetical protein
MSTMNNGIPSGWPSNVAGLGAWSKASLAADTSWIHFLSDQCLQEVERTICDLRERNVTLDSLVRDDIDCPGLVTFMRTFLQVDVGERGVGLIRGLPRERYSDQELEVLFWGLGLHLGTGVSQNAEGDRLGHVRSKALDYDALNVRGYQTSHALEFHCDPSDVVGLLCLQQALSGGESAVVSGVSVYNTVVKEHPEYLPLLQRGFVYDRRGEEAYYQQPVSDPVPVFAHVNGQVSIRYVRKSIETAMAKLDRAFSAEQLRVLDYIDEVTQRPELVVTMRMEPGDMQFVNNYSVLHARTRYEDHPEPSRRCHLLRLWLKIDDLRQLDSRFIEFDEATGWSRREGIRPPHAPPPSLNSAV